MCCLSICVYGIMDPNYWITISRSQIMDLDHGSRNLDPPDLWIWRSETLDPRIWTSHRSTTRIHRSTTRNYGPKWPFLGPFPDPSGGPNPFVRGQTRYHPGSSEGPKMAISLYIPSIGSLVSFSLSRARAKVYIGDPGTGAQDPRRGVWTRGLGSSKHPIWTTFGEV